MAKLLLHRTTANQLIDDPQTLSNNDQKELLELVRQIADFSYNYDWTDLVYLTNSKALEILIK